MPPYGAIARSMNNGQTALFIGAGASSTDVIASSLPNGRELARELAVESGYPGNPDDPLTKVAQYYVESAGDRNALLLFLLDRFHRLVPEGYQTACFKFLSELPASKIPSLIISTNYDTLLERNLELRGIPYICMSHVIGSKYGTRMIVYERLGNMTPDNLKTVIDADKQLLKARSEHGEQLKVIYKMHGSASAYVSKEHLRNMGIDADLNTIVITEQDYIDFLDKVTTAKMPVQIQKLLLTRNLLFIGYSLTDWNFRLVLHRIRANQLANTTGHWACLLHEDPVESFFWEKRGVRIYYLQLDQFLANLSQALER
jgi:hypothetical protein